ncbi:MAG TPA: heparan-alpha-glucosaminide N-acetyltransferase domain-containing protein [Bryobacteraceae bacterium]|jgi:uncharacterized membrane protein|nr:heparan-alpha-glucosaminide N-acetyltransferase domain-containing protein [Bryobacteraceae bacterium]
MNRLPFLDWTRGLAVLIMIQCHAFNSFARLDTRQEGPYVLSQFVGGMAAVLFLFLAGVTFAFQMERLDRHGAPPLARLRSMLRRGGYILGIALLFRISNSIFTIPFPPFQTLLKVDILNCMALAMLVFALLALTPAGSRARLSALLGLAVAVAAPLVSAADSESIPWLVREYLVPGRSRFAFFPWASYLAFGLAAGTTLRRLAPGRVETSLQWSLIAGFGLILVGQYFSNIPYSLYAKSQFWLDSPSLIIIRLGIILVILAGAYLWTEYVAGTGWSFVQSLGKTSLLVYWVHVILVYGWLLRHWKKALTIPQTSAVTMGIVGLMVLLSVAWLRWKARRRPRKAVSAPEPVLAEVLAQRSGL